MTTQVDWTDICAQAQMTISRALVHMKTGLFEARQESPLHCAILERMPIEFVQHNVQGIALVQNSRGIRLQVNPYTINSLPDVSSCTALLRHIEQHFYLQHPARKRRFKQHCQQNGIPFYETLFHFCTELEVNNTIPNAELSGTVCWKDVDFIPFDPTKNAEALYPTFLQAWSEDPDSIEELLEANPNCSCHAWCSDIQTNNAEEISELRDISPIVWRLIEQDVDRIIIMARESLSPKDIKAHEQQDTDGNDSQPDSLQEAFNRNNITPSAPVDIQAAKDEIERIIIRMLRIDPFFGDFLNQCILEVTDTLPTAGVALLKKHIVLAVNPTFFMQTLTSTEERGAVLKHEALHIVLKHVLQIRNPAYPNKQLYNIAADLETNQYIGAPWKLPEGALFPSSFPSLNLPLHETAEVYYDLLQKADEQSNPDVQKQKEEQANNGKGHSDHRSWNDQSQAGNHSETQGSEAGNTQPPQSPLLNGIGNAGTQDLPIHDQSIEDMVQEASKGKKPGDVPGTIQDLLAEWIKARQPAIDWKHVLRIFAKSGGKYTKKSTHRKKNKRYFRWMRQQLSQHQISADVLYHYAQHTPQQLPMRTWAEISEGLQQQALQSRPQLANVAGIDTIPWSSLDIRTVHEIRLENEHWNWPTWESIPDRLLHRFRIIKTPLDLNIVPTNVVILLAQEHPEVLPTLTWDIFGDARSSFIKKDYPNLYRMDSLAWAILPAQLIAWLTQHTDIFETLTWHDIPPQMLANNPFYQFDGQNAYMIERKIPRNLPGVKKQKEFPKLLCILDTSGSVSQRDVEYLFAEIKQIHKMGVEVYVLEADTGPQLFFEYTGVTPAYRGGGGTAFDPPLQWMNDARHGVETPIRRGTPPEVVTENLQIEFDGVVYLTDGYATTPTVVPYCKSLWIVTPDDNGGTQENLKNITYPTLILSLPSYDKRK